MKTAKAIWKLKLQVIALVIASWLGWQQHQISARQAEISRQQTVISERMLAMNQVRLDSETEVVGSYTHDVVMVGVTGPQALTLYRYRILNLDVTLDTPTWVWRDTRFRIDGMLGPIKRSRADSTTDDARADLFLYFEGAGGRRYHSTLHVTGTGFSGLHQTRGEVTAGPFVPRWPDEEN